MTVNNCHINSKTTKKKFSIILLSSLLFVILFVCVFLLTPNLSTKKTPELHNHLILTGGGKKRKKKNYTKPKKHAHIQKRIKLRYMQYYDIIDNKIYKFRKNSPEFPGCFMAEHHDRLVCGKTGLTYARV